MEEIDSNGQSFGFEAGIFASTPTWIGKCGLERELDFRLEYLNKMIINMYRIMTI